MRIAAGSRILIATHNAGKLQEFADLFAPYGIAVCSNADFGLGEPEESENTFIGNARIKARAAMLAAGLPALADDSGIMIDALGGAPGVRTADWAEGPGGRDFDRAMRRAWDALECVRAPEPRRAAFCCALVLVTPDENEIVVEGRVNGQLIWPVRGAGGHGYDPMFQPDGHDLTFAEMAASQKNQISHRARAFAKFRALCLG